MARINLGKVVPEKGIDYFTDAEVEEIKNEIKVEIDAQGMARDIELLKTDSGHTIEMTLNENYQIVLALKNAAGTALSTQTIDLPNENAITNLAYNNGVLTVTKQSGATSQINLTGLIEGLVTENDFNTFKEALQTTLEAINEKDAEQDEAIAENYKVINKLNEKVANQQKVIDQLPQVTGQGTEVTLENTIEAQFTIFDVEGNSTQETTTGKNLANIHVITNLSNQFLSRQIVGDTIVLSNNTNSSGYLPTEKNLNEICPNLKVDDIVKLSFKTTSTTAQPTNAIYLNGINQLWRINEVKTITQEMLDSKVILYGGYNETAVISEFMIRLSSITDDTYEKYTNGASPNPSYEQPIYSAGDNENEWSLESSYFSNAYATILNQVDYNLPKGTYTLSFGEVVVTSSILFRFFNADKSKQYDARVTPTIKTPTFTADEDIRYVTLIFNEADSLTKIKLEKGNKATSYSPYGMGSINEKIQNKNWLNKNSNFKTYNASVTPIDTGIKVENNDGGTYRSVWCEIGKDELLRKTLNIQTTISTYNGATPRIMVVFNNETAQYIENIKTITDTTDGTIVNIPNSFPENADRVSLIFYCSFESATPTGSYVEYKNLQVELGSTATPYVPHEEQDYSIFVQQPFRSIEDVRDCFVKKSDGKLYERHYIARKIFDGTGYWTFSADQGGHSRFDFRIADAVLGSITNNPIQSNRFRTNFAVEDNSIFLSGVKPMISIICDEFRTLDGFKTMLAEKYANGNPVYADYLRKTPLDLPCTEEQIQQIENKPSTYKDFTIINSEDETPAYLEVSGIYDMNKLITRVEVIESES